MGKLVSYIEFLEFIAGIAKNCKSKYRYVDRFIKLIDDEMLVCEDDLNQIIGIK